jgi:hypothetical protein
VDTLLLAKGRKRKAGASAPGAFEDPTGAPK